MALDLQTQPALRENPLSEGLERLPVPATTLTIFGVTGDLAQRKLLPAIYNLAHEGALPERFNLIGVSRREQSDDEFRDFARESIKEFSRREADDTVLEGLRGHVSDSGEGRWTIVDAIDYDVPVPVITAALYARFYSRGNGDYTNRVLAALRNQFGGHAVERTSGGG